MIKKTFFSFFLFLNLNLSSAADIKEAMKYMDHLKTCTPHTYTYPHPLVNGFIGKNFIKGKKGDKCVVTYFLPNDMKMECEFSPETIKMITSETTYMEVQDGQMAGSLPESASSKIKEECKL